MWIIVFIRICEIPGACVCGSSLGRVGHSHRARVDAQNARQNAKSNAKPKCKIRTPKQIPRRQGVGCRDLFVQMLSAKVGKVFNDQKAYAAVSVFVPL